MISLGYTLTIVAIGAILIGLITGILSVFFISRRQSILGDAIAHSTLAGITLIYLIIRQQQPLVFLIGALVSSLLAVLLIYSITHYTSIKEDAAIGIILSMFFGTGIVLLSRIQQTSKGSEASLKHYLFGNIAFLRLSDLLTITILGLVVLGSILVSWKELKLVSFDPEFAKTLGLPVRRYEMLILVLVVITIVIGVELIGVVMIAGLLIAPGIAARQWSSVFGRVVLISALLGALSGAIGAFLSASISNLPTGPTIIAVIGLLVVFSVIFSSNGLLAHKFKTLRYRIMYDVQESLEHLATHMLLNPRACDIREFAVKESHERDMVSEHEHSQRNHQLYDDLNVLIQLGYIKPREGGNWILTHKGMQMVEAMEDRLGINAPQINKGTGGIPA